MLRHLRRISHLHQMRLFPLIHPGLTVNWKVWSSFTCSVSFPIFVLENHVLNFVQEICFTPLHCILNSFAKLLSHFSQEGWGSTSDSITMESITRLYQVALKKNKHRSLSHNKALELWLDIETWCQSIFQIHSINPGTSWFYLNQNTCIQSGRQKYRIFNNLDK